MKYLMIILTFSFFLTSCSGLNKNIESTEIVDKTEYISSNHKWTSLKDQESIDGYTRIGTSIFGGEISCDVEPLKGIDVETFEVLAETKYAKDKKQVYYPIDIPCIDYRDCGVCFYGNILVETANPATFQYLGNAYAKDGQKVYFRGELIKDADGETFKVIAGPKLFFFAKDKNHVFKKDKIFAEADAESFYYHKNDKRNKTKTIIGDKNNEWEFQAPNKIMKLKYLK